MGQDGRAAGNGCGDAGQIQGRHLADAGNGRDDAGRHRHGHRGRTDADTDQDCHQEGQQHQGQAHRRDGRADQVAQARVLQHIPQHAAAGGDQHDEAGGLEGFGHDAFKLFHGVAVAQAQHQHGHDGGDQHGDKGLAQEAEDDRDGVLCRQDHPADRVADDEEQGDQDDGDDGGKGGQVGLVHVGLVGDPLRHGDHILFAAEGAPQRTGNDHGHRAAKDADEDDPPQIDPQHRGHQNGAGRGRDEGVADGQTRQQGNGVKEGGAPGPFGQRESQRDQNDQPGVKKDRHGDDQSGDAQGPGGLFVAKLFDHGDSQRLCAARSLQNGAEHGPQTDQQGDTLQGVADAVVDGAHDLGGRHPADQPDGDSADQDGHHRVYFEFDDKDQQDHQAGYGGKDQSCGIQCYDFSHFGHSPFSHSSSTDDSSYKYRNQAMKRPDFGYIHKTSYLCG